MDWREKVTGTVIFGTGYFLCTVLELTVPANIFLALLSAIWVLPPVAGALSKLSKLMK